MGTVYRARDPVIDRTVAIKTITASGLGPSDEDIFRRRFFLEAQAAGRLSHPGIVTIYDLGEEEGTKTPYIVMEYIAGRTLESMMSEAQGLLPLATTLDLVKQVADALNFAHIQGIVHRDIKPANIMITPEAQTKIADFGIAKLRQTQLTVPGEVLGTPSYMSPEQVEGRRTDGRADLFSLGVILYWMLTGQKPFAGEELAEVMFKIVYKDPPVATDVNPLLRTEFNYVLARTLAKDPSRRYQTGKELAEDLEDLRHVRPPRSQTSTAVPTSVSDKTVLAKPSGRVADRTAGAGEMLLTELPKGSPVIQAPSPVVAVDWERVAEYTNLARRTVLSLSILFRNHAVSFAKTLPDRSRAAVAFARRAREWTRTLPRQAHVALAVGAIVPVGFFVMWLSVALAPKAALQISLSHNFREGGVSVWVDDELVVENALMGRETRLLGLFRRIEGGFLERVAVEPGKHIIRVHVVAPGEGYDETREIEVELDKDEEKMVAVSCDSRKGFLNLSLR